MLTAAIDIKPLWETVVAAVIAGLGVTLAFSITILGFTRMADLSREERLPEAFLFGAIGVVSSAVWIAAIVFGVIVMAS
ncbi:hypothetical protein HJD18_10950 [Thermoleophilia bacterium SCSIO 60948]|nr:hypothetical protein HJD18_10950 [Thermoleophilia bacterium SCSIO 60948]